MIIQLVSCPLDLSAKVFFFVQCKTHDFTTLKKIYADSWFYFPPFFAG